MSNDKPGDIIKLDLVIGDDDANDDSKSDEDVPEVLVLRILSTKANFKFGGLELSVKSPAFEVGKTFTVSLDEGNKVSSIDTISEQFSSGHTSRSASPSRSTTPASATGSRRVSLVRSLALKPARIIVNPSEETEQNQGLPLLSARMTIEEKVGNCRCKNLFARSTKTPSPIFGTPRGSPFRTRIMNEEEDGEPVIYRYGTSPEKDRNFPRSRGASPFRHQAPEPEKVMVSVGVGTSSHPRESLYFDVERTLRRSKSWRK